MSSCISNKKLIYLQEAEGAPIQIGDSLYVYNQPEYRLQYNDIIDVQITTELENINDLFDGGNRQLNVAARAGSQGGGDIYYMTGHSINRGGFIELPLLGQIQVAHLTLEEAKQHIENKVRSLANDEVFVRVKLGGIRYSTMGEFRNPGKFVVLQDRMTIFEAISLSGDLTHLAKRDEILLIRQNPDGVQLQRLNLMDRNIIQSPYFFIQPNDQLYAEPMRVRELGTGENAAQSISLLITSLSVVALVLNLITR
ncbi:MAG TPA: polysaccharide biosynthesis/export family protein [Lunatimonas sp.]|nr:polysaccharide biosynthesis/export family protein [Lunatimonas sp.]